MKIKYALAGIREAIRIHGGDTPVTEIVSLTYLDDMTAMEAAMLYAEGEEANDIASIDNMFDENKED